MGSEGLGAWGLQLPTEPVLSRVLGSKESRRFGTFFTSFFMGLAACAKVLLRLPLVGGHFVSRVDRFDHGSTFLTIGRAWLELVCACCFLDWGSGSAPPSSSTKLDRDRMEKFSSFALEETRASLACTRISLAPNRDQRCEMMTSRRLTRVSLIPLK